MGRTCTAVLAVVLELTDEGDEEPVFTVATVLGGTPSEAPDGNKLSDAEWLVEHVSQCGGVADAIFDNEIPPEIAKQEVCVVIGRMVAESYDTDCGTEHDAYFEIDKLLTEEQAMLALKSAA